MKMSLVAGTLVGFVFAAHAAVIRPDRIEAAPGVNVAVRENGDVTIAADGREVEEVRLVWKRTHAPGARIFRNDWDLTNETTRWQAEVDRVAAWEPAPYRENCYPAPDIFYPGILPAYGLYVDYADDVVLKNVKFRTLAEGPVELRPEVVRTGR